MSKFRSRLELHTATGRHILAAASDVCVVEELNGDYYVTFTYPKLPDDSERYDDLIEDNEVRFPVKYERGQHFVIKRVDEIRKGLRIYKQVEAYHVAFKLGQYFLDDYVDFAANQPPAFLLAKIGNNTPFTFAVEGNFANQDVFDFGEKSKLVLFDQARELYGGERVYNNYNITLTTRAGGNHGVEIRYRKNLTGITRSSHSMERVTRLYGYGKAGLTIEGYGGHSVKYIDSQYFDPNNPYMGSVEFPEIDTQAKLLDAMQRHLREYEIPKVSYDIDFVQLEKVDDEFKAEAIRGIGDTVTVIDELLGYRFDARVHRYERYPFEPKRGRVVLANFRELTNGDVLFRATVAGKRAMVYTSENAILKGIKYDDSITVVDGLGIRVSDDHDRELVRLGQVGAGQYGMTMYNKAGSRTLWQDAATGNAYFSGTLQAANGEFSGKITATSGLIGGWTINNGSLSGNGQIIGGVITGSSLNGGTITGSVVNGAIINGGTITGTTIQTAATGDFAKLTSGYSTIGFYSSGFAQANFEIANQGSRTLLWSPRMTTVQLGEPGDSFLSRGSFTFDGFTRFNAGVNFGLSATVTGLTIARVEGLQANLTSLSNRISALEQG